MRLCVPLVLIALFSNSYGHFVYLPVAGPEQFLPPTYHYVIHHPQALVPPVVVQHPADPVSRETLEEHSDEHNVPDISDEQAQLDPDDTQEHKKPQLPSVPRPYPRPTPTPHPHIPAHNPHIPAPNPHIPAHNPYIPPVNIPHIPVPSPHIPSGHHPDSGDAPNIIFNGPQPDGSYDFSYDLGDQSRSEKSDADGNVQGTYTYTGADGKKVTITYSAGAHKGFIPEGEGLLPPPPADCEGDESQQIPQEPQRPHIPDEEDDGQQHIPPVIPPTRPHTKNPHEGGEEVGGHKGMPYNYNYDAGLSSKTETADDNGNVQGSYTYVDGAGVTRTVKYTVNGDEGFIATGDIHPDPGTQGAESNHGISSSTAPPVWGGSSHGTKGPHYLPPTAPPTWINPGVKGGHGTKIPNHPLTPPSSKGGQGTKTPHHPPVKGTKGGSGWDKYPLGG